MTVLIKKKATDSHAYRQSEKVLYSVTVFIFGWSLKFSSLLWAQVSEITRKLLSVQASFIEQLEMLTKANPGS